MGLVLEANFQWRVLRKQ